MQHSSEYFHHTVANEMGLDVRMYVMKHVGLTLDFLLRQAMQAVLTHLRLTEADVSEDLFLAFDLAPSLVGSSNSSIESSGIPGNALPGSSSLGGRSPFIGDGGAVQIRDGSIADQFCLCPVDSSQVRGTNE